jgi:hypothetical protein
MSEYGRIARFVRAVRSLLMMQLAAALLAVLLAVWALTAVWEMAAERDRLRAQVQALEGRAPETAATIEEVNTARPLENGVRPPAILPIAIPVPEVAPDVNTILPGSSLTLPPTNQVTPPAIVPPTAEQDCSGAAAALPRCRPGRWNRQVPRAEPEPKAETPPAPEPRKE